MLHIQKISSLYLVTKLRSWCNWLIIQWLMTSSPKVSHYLHVQVIMDSYKSRHFKYNLNENGIVIVSSNEIHSANELTVILKRFKNNVAYFGYSKNTFFIQTNVSSLYKPARWSHIFIHIVQKPCESSNSIIHPKFATQYSNVHLLFLSSYIKFKSNYILYHIHLWIWMYTPSFFFIFSLSLSLSLSFSFYQYLFHRIRIIMYPLRLVMLSSFAYFVNPPVWCFQLVTLFDIIFFWNV